MTLHDKLAQLRSLLQDIEDEGGDALSVAHDVIGGHIDKGTTAGKVIAREWHRLRALVPLPCYFAGGLVGATKVTVDAQSGRPIADAVEVAHPLHGQSVTLGVYQMIANRGLPVYACCEDSESFVAWQSSVRADAQRLNGGDHPPGLLALPASWNVAGHEDDTGSDFSLFSMEGVRAWNDRAQELSQAVRGDGTSRRPSYTWTLECTYGRVPEIERNRATYGMSNVRAWNDRAQELSQAVRGEDT